MVGGGGFISTARVVVGGLIRPVMLPTATDAVAPIVVVVVVVVVVELSIFLPLLLMYSSTASRISLRMISYSTDSN